MLKCSLMVGMFIQYLAIVNKQVEFVRCDAQESYDLCLIISKHY